MINTIRFTCNSDIFNQMMNCRVGRTSIGLKFGNNFIHYERMILFLPSPSLALGGKFIWGCKCISNSLEVPIPK